MKDWAVRLYHSLPPVLRSLVASSRGLYLRRWRYGPETEQLVAAALDRELWSGDQWKKWQEERLAYLLHRAATVVPYYRQIWAERRRRGDQASWDYLENWPILEKESVRRATKLFLADDCHAGRMFEQHTSGTTGTPIRLLWNRSDLRAQYALFEARARRWNNVSRFDGWAILGGQLVSPVAQRRPPFWIWNGSLNQLYMSSYHLAPDLIPYYLEALKKFDVKYLYGYSSSLYSLAYEALRIGYSDLHMKVSITNAEPIYDYQRNVIEKAFHGPVRETYGMAEVVAAASECGSGSLHYWPEVGIIEVMDNLQPVSNGDSGDLVCTGLLNTDMPLIRYRVGDRGAVNCDENVCKCGRALPTIRSVEGRIDDVLYTSDGRRIGRLDPIFKAGLPIREAQVIQETLNRIKVLYVPEPGFTRETTNLIIARLQARMGPVEVILEPIAEIPRTNNGKFRAVVSNLPKPQIEMLQKEGDVTK